MEKINTLSLYYYLINIVKVKPLSLIAFLSPVKLKNNYLFSSKGETQEHYSPLPLVYSSPHYIYILIITVWS